MIKYRALCAALLCALVSVPAGATPFNSLSMDVGVCDPDAPSRCIKPDASGNVPITGSISLGGFHAESALAPLAVTTSSGTSGTFTAGKVVVVTNVGTTNTAYCLQGVVATTQVQAITPNGGWFAFTTTSETAISCITSTGTTTVNLLVGTGLPTGTGGGGGSGGGGAVTVADGADVTQGANADAAVAAGAAGTVSAKLRRLTTDMGTVATNSALPLPAQSNFTTNIGAVTLNDANSNAVLNDPCQTVAKTYTPINVVTATNTIITGVAAKKKYICGIFLYPAGTTNVAIFQATTATACATALVGVIGGTTTATGMVMTAQAGFVLGTGASSVAATTVNQTDLCIVTSAAVQVSGVVVTVDR